MDKYTTKYKKSLKRYLRRILTGTVALVFIFAAATVSASAIEVPRGVTEVKVPVSLEAASAIAGAEISFTKTSGLKYLRYEPASGLEHPVRADADGKTWVGFFSSANKYSPAAGKIAMGNLVFSYEGDATEHVKVADVKLHSLTAPENVESKKSMPGTDIPVTRQSAASGGKTETPDDGGIVVNPGAGKTKPGGKDKGSSGGKVPGKGSASGDKLTPDKNSSAGSDAGKGSNNKSTPSGNSTHPATKPADPQRPPASAGTGAKATESTSAGTSGSGIVSDAADESVMVPFTKDEGLKGISDEAAPVAGPNEQGGVNWFILFIIAMVGVGVLLLLMGKRWKDDRDKNKTT